MFTQVKTSNFKVSVHNLPGYFHRVCGAFPMTLIPMARYSENPTPKPNPNPNPNTLVKANQWGPTRVKLTGECEPLTRVKLTGER